jgi:hypothetical protein
LHFVAEAFGPALAEQLDDVVDGLFGAVAEMNAVVARQIR